MVTQQSAIETVNSFVKDVKAEGINLNRVILYGSFSRNQQHEYSDIDVALISDQFSGIGFRDIPLFVKALRKYYVIQPKTFSSEDFNNENALAEEILRNGIEINV